MLDVLLYSMLEVALDLEREVDNPYDPEQVVVEVVVEPPDGGPYSWPAYYDGEGWRVRLRPTQHGEHSAEVSWNGEPVESFVFHVEPSADPGPIAPDGHGFRHADGTPFVALGANLGWSAGGGTGDYDRWFGDMAAHGGSFARIWFTHFTDQDPEWLELGRMDPTAAANIDTILDLAQEHGILLMPVLWQHSELESAMWSSWDGNPYNAANGGPCEDSNCFFDDPDALAYQQAYVRYCVARWGAHPATGAWEVMNELDAIVGVDSDVTAAWAASHAETIRQLESGLHPVSFSYSLPPQAVSDQPWEGADFTQVHSYMFSAVEPVALGVSTSLERVAAPVLVGEWGLDWYGNNDREDVEGLSWHNASWAAVASGSAGNALSWWWDDHLEPHDLWWRLEGLAAVTAGLDLPAMAPVVATASDDDLEAYARSDGDVTLVWVHALEHVVPEPEVETFSGENIVLDGKPMGYETFDTSTGEQVGVFAVACDGVIALPDFEGDIAVIAESDGFSCDEPEPGCGCAAGLRAGLGLAPLLGLLGLAGRRKGHRATTTRQG